jgi:hypothetical protein
MADRTVFRRDGARCPGIMIHYRPIVLPAGFVLEVLAPVILVLLTGKGRNTDFATSLSFTRAAVLTACIVRTGRSGNV